MLGQAAELKTKFPPGKIKRIMQSDEEVGKVAQVTPILVSKALEQFMQRLLDEAVVVMRRRASKRVQIPHFKEAIHGNDQFDFLVDLVDDKYVDAPSGKEGGGSGSRRKSQTLGDASDAPPTAASKRKSISEADEESAHRKRAVKAEAEE